jgi:hypothetical protein
MQNEHKRKDRAFAPLKRTLFENLLGLLYHPCTLESLRALFGFVTTVTTV